MTIVKDTLSVPLWDTFSFTFFPNGSVWFISIILICSLVVVVKIKVMDQMIRYFIGTKKKRVTFDETKNTIVYYEKYL